MPAHEGEQFDIRTTVEEFKQSVVAMYSLWKPGMEIQVSHIKRRNVPLFVFPGGVKPSRPSRAEDHALSKARASSSNKFSSKIVETCRKNGDKSVEVADAFSKRDQFDAIASGGEGNLAEGSNTFMSTLLPFSASSMCIKTEEGLGTKLSNSPESNGIVDVDIESRKRKHVDDVVDNNSTDLKHMVHHSVISPETVRTEVSGDSATEAFGASLCVKNAEALAINNSSCSSPGLTTLPEELDDYELNGKAKDLGAAVSSHTVEPSAGKDVRMQAGNSSSNNFTNGGVEELEVLAFGLSFLLLLKNLSFADSCGGYCHVIPLFMYLSSVQLGRFNIQTRMFGEKSGGKKIYFQLELDFFLKK